MTYKPSFHMMCMEKMMTRRTTLLLDSDLVARAATLLGTRTATETVDAALRAVAGQPARLEALRRAGLGAADAGESDDDPWEDRV